MCLNNNKKKFPKKRETSIKNNRYNPIHRSLNKSILCRALYILQFPRSSIHRLSGRCLREDEEKLEVVSSEENAVNQADSPLSQAKMSSFLLLSQVDPPTRLRAATHAVTCTRNDRRPILTGRRAHIQMIRPRVSLGRFAAEPLSRARRSPNYSLLNIAGNIGRRRDAMQRHARRAPPPNNFLSFPARACACVRATLYIF